MPLPPADAPARLGSLRWSARSRLAEHRAYLPIARRRHGHRVVSRDSQVVIDGFTRSACVYAAVAFQQAQPHPVRLAHLIHAPSQILEAVRFGVPTILTVREPRGAVLSCVIREPQVTVKAALTAWVRFHRRVLPVRDSIVVGEFGDVTERFGAVIERMNDRFGTTFTPYGGDAEAEQRVFALIDERASRPPWEDYIGYYMSGLIGEDELAAARREHDGWEATDEAGAVPFELRVARPTEDKQRKRAALASSYEDRRLERLRREADALYQRLVPEAVMQP